MTILPGEGLQPDSTDRIAPENLPSIPQTNGERLMPTLKPVRGEDGKIDHYILKTPSGKHEIEYDPTSVEMLILKRTLGEITADQWEALSPFDLAAQIRSQLKTFGLKEKDIPTEPEALIKKGAELVRGTVELQKAVRAGRQENVLQAFLDLELRVLVGGKEEWRELNPIQKEIVIDMTQTLVAQMLSQMGINQQAVETTKIIKEVDAILQKRKINFAGAFGEQSGLLIGNIIEQLSQKLLPVFVGQQKAQQGLLGAGTAVIDEAVRKAGAWAGDGIDEIKEKFGKKQPGEKSTSDPDESYQVPPVF